ncbi:MFS transporter [Naumannella cuiyingiana]|uniref:Putative MFS family arabinose efflux permease n=1 Tax=Naumannella cuiyingiana TaxID=1347891 RepID=A0A7Z0D6I9_9ACTN|nr:putative MFS family arabinose efflux permease [Naumannella cuiyingiana]
MSPADRPARYRHGDRGYRQITVALFAAGLATFIGLYSTQALLPELSAVFAVGPASAALSVSVTTGALAIFVLPISALSDRFGRRRVMIISAIGSAAIGLALPLAASWPVLLAGRALQGVALAGVPAVAMAYLAEEVDPSALGAAMGRYIGGTTIGGLIGRLTPGLTLDLADWRVALLAAAVLAGVAAALFAALSPRSAHFSPAPATPRRIAAGVVRHLRTPALLALYALAFVLMGGFVTVYNYLGYRLLAPPFSLPPGAVALIFLLYLAGTVSATWAGRLADRRGRSRVLAVTVGATLLGLAITLAPWLPAVLAGTALFTAGFFAAHAVASGWVGALADRDRGTASGLYLCGYYAGSSVIGALGGVVFAAGGWPAVVGYVGALCLVAFVLGRVPAGIGRAGGHRP